VLPQKAQRRRTVLNDVICECDVFNSGPGRGALIVPNCKHDSPSCLCIDPVVFKDIAIDRYPSRVFQLEEVLNCPMSAGITWVAHFPTQRLEEIVVPNLNVGGNQVLDTRVGPAEHYVLAGPFQMVVDDLERTWTTPTANCLRVVAFSMDLRDVGVGD